MNRKRSISQKGSVVIVALCFAAVLGIILASYLAVSSQAVKLSNQSYLKSVSKNLAEMGLEQALWAFNRHNWDPSMWDLSVPTKATLKPSIDVPSSLYGNGTAGLVNVRVENYDAPDVASEWKSSLTYSVGQIVSYDRISDWNPSFSYVTNDIITLGSKKYRCIQSNSSRDPLTQPTYWVELLASEFFDFRRWYRCKNPTNNPPPNQNWEDCTPVIYAAGTATPPASAGQPISTQLRGRISTCPLFPNAAGATSSLILNAASTVDSYDSVVDPTASTPGYSAVLASTSTTNPAVTVISAVVQGYIAAPSSLLLQSLTQFGGSASLKNKNGSVNSPHPSAPNVDLSRVSRSPFVPRFFPAIWYSSTGFRPSDVVRRPSYTGDLNLYLCIQKNTDQEPPDPTYWKPPESPPLSVAAPVNLSIGTAGGPLKNYVINGDLYLDTGDSITINGPVILDIQGQLHIRNTGSITIAPSGSAEIIFSGRLSVGGPSAAQSGFDNQTKNPKKLTLIGTASATPGTNRYWAVLPFYGVIYMPNLIATLNIQSDIFGAVSAGSVTFPSATSLHYDTSLRTITYHTVDFLYVITDWRELTDPAEQITFP